MRTCLAATLPSLLALHAFADEGWQENGVGPQPAEAFGRLAEEQNPHIAGLDVELSIDSWPGITRRPVPYYSIDYASSLMQHLQRGDFGRVAIPGATFQSVERKGGDWTHVWMRYRSTDPSIFLDTWVSRLSPAVIFRTDADSLGFFMGAGSIQPGYLATRTAQSVVVRPAAEAGELLVSELARSWLLVWFAGKSQFEAVDYPWPMCFEGWKPGPRYAADCPFLVLFGNAPESIAADESGLIARFGGSAGSAALMPLFGQRHPKIEETSAWADGLPENVVAPCDWLSEHLCEVPVSARESYAYDAPSDTVTVSTRVSFQRVQSGGHRFAPLPPMLALARAYGFPMALSAEPITTHFLTYYGPYAGIEDADAYSVALAGLGRYALQRKQVAAQPREGAGLRQRLEDEINAVLEAGHLAPWYIAMSDFGAGYQYYWRNQHSLLWSNPGETLYILSQALPLLSDDLAARVREYMKRERTEYPPESIAHTPAAVGARRERYSLDESLLAEHQERVERTNFYMVNHLIPEESIYYLAEYYQTLGEAPEQGVWDAVKSIMQPYLVTQDWATLGWFKRDVPDRFSTRGLGGVVDANCHFAATVGLIRLARMTSDTETEALGWGLLAQAALLRYGMAKYACYIHESGLIVLPKEPDWMIKYTSGSWSGRLYTYQWTSGADDVRSIARMEQFGVQFDDVFDWYHGTGLPKLCGMVPELGRLLKDHLRAEVETFVSRVEENVPDWYLAYGTMNYGAEFYYPQPQDPYQLFLAKAWVTDEKPEKLEGYLDVSWMKRGDLYYIHKLAETIKAYRGIQWEQVAQ